MSSLNKLIKEAVREFLISEAAIHAGSKASRQKGDNEKIEALDDLQYELVARKLVWNYEDGTMDQNISRLVDNYCKSYKATHGVEIDNEKLYDAVIEQMKNYSGSVDHPATNFSPERGSK